VSIIFYIRAWIFVVVVVVVVVLVERAVLLNTFSMGSIHGREQQPAA